MRQSWQQIRSLVDEYTEVADRTNNADLTALVFQLRLVLDDHAGPIPPTPTLSGDDVRVWPEDSP